MGFYETLVLINLQYSELCCYIRAEKGFIKFDIYINSLVLVEDSVLCSIKDGRLFLEFWVRIRTYIEPRKVN